MWPRYRFAHGMSLCFLVFSCMCENAIGVERYFLPGDACFHSQIDRGVLESLAKTDAWTLGYIVPRWEEPKSKELVGYEVLKVRNCPLSFRKNLDALYWHFRSLRPERSVTYLQNDNTEERVVVNGMHVFLFNKNYNLGKFGVGARFNEDWHSLWKVKQASEPCEHADSTVYSTFCESASAVAWDWRYAEKVDGLRCDLSRRDFHLTPHKADVNIDAIVDFSAILVVIVVDEDICGQFTCRDGAEVFIVSESGIDRGMWQDLEFEREKFTPTESSGRRIIK